MSRCTCAQQVCALGQAPLYECFLLELASFNRTIIVIFKNNYPCAACLYGTGRGLLNDKSEDKSKPTVQHALHSTNSAQHVRGQDI